MQAADLTCFNTAREQYGLIRHDQCLEAGLSKRAIGSRLREHGWTPVLPGVYRLPGVGISRLGDMKAALLWAGKGSALWGPSAGLALGLDGIPGNGPIHVCTHRNLVSADVKVHRLKAEDRPRMMHTKGLAVTRVERTLLDMASCLPPMNVGEAMDHALRDRRTTLDLLWAEVLNRTTRGVRGVNNYRVLLKGRDLRDSVVRSKFETKMLRVLKRITEHPVVPDFEVRLPSRRYVIDFAYPSLKLGIECQSIRWHLATDRLKRDLARDRHLKRAGWTILYYSWDDVCFRATEVESEVRTFLTDLFRNEHAYGIQIGKGR